jgi:hypothetical protein
VRSRWLSETDYNHQIIRLREGLSYKQLAQQFWLRVVRAMHYSAGLDDGCPEESFTHGYAAALMSFIRANPEVWVWFNRLLDTVIKPGARYSCYAAGERELEPLAPPRRFVVGRRVYSLQSMPAALSAKLKCWGDCHLSKHVVRLSDELYGAQLAIIFWHELTHAMHHEDGLDDGDSWALFARSQATRSLQFMLRNPDAWRWFLCLSSHAANDLHVAAEPWRLAA